MNKETILKALSNIIDPDLHKDIVSLGFIKNLTIDGASVSFEIELTTPACPVKNQFKEAAEKLVTEIPGVESVKVIMTSRKANPHNRESGLRKVNSIIAVASCKGGVGKSTVAATVALELADRGVKVGLLDADLFGPSLGTLFDVHKVDIQQKENMLIPVEINNLKTMSFGFLLDDSPAIMRGPMVSGYMQQLLHSVDWGELDYLIIDMPPGTGDIQLTLAQSVRLDGAVIVTTRSGLSLVDVARGILMFEKVDIPMLGVIENMSWFICDSCDKKHFIFGDNNSLLSDRFGLKTLAHIPMEGGRARPFKEYRSDELNTALVDNLVKELGRVSAESQRPPEVIPGREETTFAWEDGSRTVVDNLDLRDSCGCALCVDEYTGEKNLNREDIPSDIQPLEAVALGNYAVSIKWNDGHTSSIYPYKKIRGLENS